MPTTSTSSFQSTFGNNQNDRWVNRSMRCVQEEFEKVQNELLLQICKEMQENTIIDKKRTYFKKRGFELLVSMVKLSFIISMLIFKNRRFDKKQLHSKISIKNKFCTKEWFWNNMTIYSYCKYSFESFQRSKICFERF